MHNVGEGEVSSKYANLPGGHHQNRDLCLIAIMATPAAAGPDTLVNIKVVIDGNTRRFKLALRDLGASSLENKVSWIPVAF